MSSFSDTKESSLCAQINTNMLFSTKNLQKYHCSAKKMWAWHTIAAVQIVNIKALLSVYAYGNKLKWGSSFALNKNTIQFQCIWLDKFWMISVQWESQKLQEELEVN